MNYELHILRDVHDYHDYLGRDEGSTPSIEQEDWLDFASIQPDLLLAEQAEYLTSGETPLYLYRASSSGESLSLTWYDGEVSVNGGDGSEEEIAEVVALATRLSARLFGDEGELYDAYGVGHID